MSRIKRFGVSISEDLLKEFDTFINKKGYPTRSKAIEDIFRETLKRESIRTGKKGTGAIILVYDHHKRELVSKLIDIQHDFHNLVICNQHIHLDHYKCMEIIVVKGTYEQMQELADKLQSAKGVKHGSLSIAEAH
jgi:CopG family nickel-responsive transcriptional regulator